jgi:hypothetical protein
MAGKLLDEIAASDYEPPATGACRLTIIAKARRGAMLAPRQLFQQDVPAGCRNTREPTAGPASAGLLFGGSRAFPGAEQGYCGHCGFA